MQIRGYWRSKPNSLELRRYDQIQALIHDFGSRSANFPFVSLVRFKE